jgi:2-succinyl-5-enolpyruvyl-6-hydroxy-3-cyclohexene-1-carboxylate synthase
VDREAVTEGDVALACARAFVGGLARLGVTDAAISPGSRSTPIALAFARDERTRVHVHLDERASAFFALGLAKASNRPVAVVTTSGTAVANMFPAVVEASMSRVPLLVLTADRPPELRGTGANQTIDQVELFGTYVRWFVDAPLPSDGPDAPRVWTALADESYHAVCAPGPVHVNLPYREPLVPAGNRIEVADDSVDGAASGTRPGEGPPPNDNDIGEFVGEVARVEHGFLYLGGLRCPSRSLLELGERLGWPVIAEPTSGLRVPGTLSAGQFLLANGGFTREHTPDLVVQFGAAPTSRAALAFVGGAPRLVIVDPDDIVADPNRRAERRVVAAAEQLAREAISRVEPRDRRAWLDRWRRADDRAREVVDATIGGWDEPYEGRIARDLATSLPDGATLVVGSSMPVRDLDAYMHPRDGLRVLANRGASGIDGFVSTALGVAATGVPTTALCGDLTLLHDAGSLLWSAKRGYDCVFVVPNNDGGAVFSFLPQRDLPEFDELFATPHGGDLAVVCAAAGAGHSIANRASDLIPIVTAAREAGGVRVVEVPTDRDENVRRHADVHAAVAAALERTI